MRDTLEGREQFNISGGSAGGEGHTGGVGKGEESGSPAQQIQDGSMPLPIYLIMHPEARLTAEGKQLLGAGIEATFGASSVAATAVVNAP